jgi:rhodanese-related sulfurtransferase
LRFLALGALALGFLAIFAGSPSQLTVTVDLQKLARSIETEEDHIAPSELARRIMNNQNTIRIVDVRDSASFAHYHIPGAERHDIQSLLRSPFSPSDTLVIYSDGGIHASQAWFLLRMRGFENAYTIRGGLALWNEEVRNPLIDPQMPPDVRDSLFVIAEYFGGTPNPARTAKQSPPSHTHQKPVQFQRERERTRDGC